MTLPSENHPHLALDPEFWRTLDDAEHQASIRAWEALMLARTPEAWAQLLKGHPVPVDQLDHVYLQRARARRLT